MSERARQAQAHLGNDGSGAVSGMASGATGGVAGGAVSDPQHRDHGSLLTLSVLLTSPAEFEGAALLLHGAEAPGTPEDEAADLAPPLACGDGMLFASEKRHNVTPLTEGTRRSFIIELWEGPTNRHNRHR